MTVFRKELRQGRVALLVWTALLASALGMCILVFPDMKGEMEGMADSLAQMGEFGTALGIEQLNVGKFQDFFGLEFSSIMGLLGALFASLLGIRALAGEEGGHTAEFLLTHPVPRGQVAGEKLLALFVQVILLNLLVAGVSFALIAAIGEEIQRDRVALLFVGSTLMHLELAAITFGISAFLKRNCFVLGIGVGAAAYFLNILSNLMEELEFLKYITPMGYTDSAEILYEGALNGKYLASGMVLLVLSAAVGLWQYSRKDIT